MGDGSRAARGKDDRRGSDSHPGWGSKTTLPRSLPGEVEPGREIVYFSILDKDTAFNQSANLSNGLYHWSLGLCLGNV